MTSLEHIFSPDPLLTEKRRAFAMRDQLSHAFQSGHNCVERLDAIVELGRRMAPLIETLTPDHRRDLPLWLANTTDFRLLLIGILENLPSEHRGLAVYEWGLPAPTFPRSVSELPALKARVRHLCEVMDGTCPESIHRDGADFWPHLAFPGLDGPLLLIQNFNPRHERPVMNLACQTLPEGASTEGLRYVQLSARMLAGLCRQYLDDKGADDLQVQARACQAFLLGLHRYSHHRQQEVLNLGFDTLCCPAWVWQGMWNRVLDSGLDTGLHDPFAILVEQESLQANVAPAPENLFPRTARRL
jgi:hypothetical protein